MKSENSTSTASPAILAFLIGLTAGAVSGILLTPRSGKENRDMIKQKTHDSLANAHDQINSSKDLLTSKVSDAINTTKAAINEGKKTYRDSLKDDKSQSDTEL